MIYLIQMNFIKIDLNQIKQNQVCADQYINQCGGTGRSQVFPSSADPAKTDLRFNQCKNAEALCL